MSFRLDSPFPEQYLPKLWEFTEHFRQAMLDDYSPQNLEQLHEFSGRSIGYAVVNKSDGSLAGGLMFEPMGDDMYVGHLVFAPSGVAKEIKYAAAVMAMNRLFAAGARKISWRYFGDNEPFRRFLLKLGAEDEGRLKQATRRKGELCDVVLMASFSK